MQVKKKIKKKTKIIEKEKMIMNKKLSVFAIILIIVGLIGTIWSGINTRPSIPCPLSNRQSPAGYMPTSSR